MIFYFRHHTFAYLSAGLHTLFPLILTTSHHRGHGILVDPDKLQYEMQIVVKSNLFLQENGLAAEVRSPHFWLVLSHK